MRLVVPPLNESEARGYLVLINKKKHSAFLRVNDIIFNSFAREPDRTELIRCMLSIYLIMWPLSLMASFLHMSMAKSCMLANTKTAWISRGNIQSSYFSEFSSNSFWGARTRGVARHVRIAFNFTKHRKRFTSPLGLYLSEFSEGSTLLKRQALRFWFPPENSR